MLEISGLRGSPKLRQVDRELQVSPIVVEGVMFVSDPREGWLPS